MDHWNTVIADITPTIRDILHYIPLEERKDIQEIRIRARAPLMLSLPNGIAYLKTDSHITHNPNDIVVYCDHQSVEDTFLRLCGFAIHAHEEEICKGFIRTSNGGRCGIAGEVVVKNGHIQSYRRITSLCIRIAREHTGCADEILKHVFNDKRPHSVLLCGEPASGKTSLLRDLASTLSNPVKGNAFRIAVVDERGELAGLDTLSLCDVLSGCPKSIGISHAIRCLAPDMVFFDELGSAEEVSAVRQSMRCGVSVVTSVHADGKEALKNQRAVCELLEDGAFTHIVFLEGRHQPCKVKQLYTLKEWNYEMDRYMLGGCGGRLNRVYEGGRHETARAHTRRLHSVGAMSANRISLPQNVIIRSSGKLCGTAVLSRTQISSSEATSHASTSESADK